MIQKYNLNMIKYAKYILCFKKLFSTFGLYSLQAYHFGWRALTWIENNVNHSRYWYEKLRTLYYKNGRAPPRERLDQLKEAARVLDTRSRLDKISAEWKFWWKTNLIAKSNISLSSSTKLGGCFSSACPWSKIPSATCTSFNHSMHWSQS